MKPLRPSSTSQISESGGTRLGLEAPAGNPRYPQLDALRAIAAFSVLFYHVNAVHRLPGPVGRLAGHGDIGVVLFFLISGFLLYRPFVTARRGIAPRVPIGRFYVARLLRIVPAYWVALTLVAVWPGITEFGSRWWQFYLFGQIYDPKTVFSGLGPAWSLCVEISFYLLLPLYALVAGVFLERLRDESTRCYVELAGLSVLALISIAAHVIISRHPADADLAYTLPGTFYLFAIGMALALVSTQSWFGHLFDRWRHWSLVSWLIAACIFAVIAMTLTSKSTGSVNPVYAPTALLVLLPAVAPSRGLTVKITSFGLLRWLGAVSYGFYLWHQTIVVQLNHHVGSVWIVLVVAAGLAVLIASASYYLVERPFLQLKAQLRGSRS